MDARPPAKLDELAPPLPAAAPRRRTHDLVYNILLGILAFCQLLSGLVIWLICFVPGAAFTPDALWAMHFAIALQFGYGTFEASVLIVRITVPRSGKWPTVALNICLLTLFPFGTLLGFYGLWKADRAPTPPVASPFSGAQLGIQ
jgi:hypothetical protein